MTRQKTAAKLPRLLSPRELAERTSVPRGTWYQVIADGALPVHRIGRSVRVDEEDAAKYLASCREVVR